MPDSLAHAVYKRDLIKASLERAAKRVGTQQAAVASAEAEVRGMEARIAVAREAQKGAEAQLATTVSNLGDTEIRAPFDGVVLRKEADVGEMVVPALMGGGQTRGSVVTLADFATLEMEVDVFERDLRLVKESSPPRSFSMPIRKSVSPDACAKLNRRPTAKRRRSW
jgi:multidrug efflux pump subunit AcrA (membrane-fusion protein)